MHSYLLGTNDNTRKDTLPEKITFPVRHHPIS